MTSNGLTAIEFYNNFTFEGCAEAGEKDADGKQCDCRQVNKVVGPLYFLDTSRQNGGNLQMIAVIPTFLENNSLAVSAEEIKKSPNLLNFKKSPHQIDAGSVLIGKCRKFYLVTLLTA